ncbi:MAG: hypothetical protein C4520_18580 [Candidatus Abyssobacteria bacterium SURF_5]|uniref:Uncharacterized protein n=1 Tax=Abyssobacteria bacterium (strain SURF_5) TaxID=2093360 RepID=A0A3A4NCD5_ABYX5|nr:MAG: hypothetical protein C4520_18580 [Candidatus Abyssubacteria bacterium SURF_5]
MKKRIIFLSCVWTVLIASASANAIPLSENLEGYYKFDFTDGVTYAAKVEQGIGAIKVYVLPDLQTAYIGIIVGDEIYFQDNAPYWAVLRQVNEDTALISVTNADTGEMHEFSVVRIGELAASQIVEEIERTNVDAACGRNLKFIGLALAIFANDHDGELPNDLSELHPYYVSDLMTFVCPARGGEFVDFDTDYVYTPGYSIDSPNAGEEVTVIEVEGNHASFAGHVLYLDGHVEKDLGD